MNDLGKGNDTPRLSLDGMVQVPAREIPAFVADAAIQRGVDKQFLFRTWGGLGDIVCAEPTLRYALNRFKGDVKVSLETPYPDLFSHLPFERVYNPDKEFINYTQYMTLETIKQPHSLLWNFLSHAICHPVDFTSICALRCTLPHADKEIQLPDYAFPDLDQYMRNDTIVVHAGKHWESKTFPVEWWSEVVRLLLQGPFKRVVLIGKRVDENIGYVDVPVTEGVVDLRDRQSLRELIYLLKGCSFLLSNDSSPIHIAAAGDAHIGFIATCKHQDYLKHWRRGQFGYKTMHFNHGGMWEIFSPNPVQKDSIVLEDCPPEMLAKFLPEPRAIAEYYSGLKASV